MPEKPRVGFVTAVQLGAECIEQISDLGGELEVIVTLDRESAPQKTGRADIFGLGEQLHVPVIGVRNINSPAVVDQIAAADLDWLFIIGWSQIAGPKVINSTGKGVIGAHLDTPSRGQGASTDSVDDHPRPLGVWRDAIPSG